MSQSPTVVTSSMAASPTWRCRAAGSHGSRSWSTCAASSCSGSRARRRMPWCSSRVHLACSAATPSLPSAATTGPRSARTWISASGCSDISASAASRPASRSTPIRSAGPRRPKTWRRSKSQRCRWRRGLLQTLWRNRGMIGNPRFGKVGLGALPYMAFFEGLGPLLEVAGYVVTIVAAALGYLNWITSA